MNSTLFDIVCSVIKYVLSDIRKHASLMSVFESRYEQLLRLMNKKSRVRTFLADDHLKGMCELQQQKLNLILEVCSSEKQYQIFH